MSHDQMRVPESPRCHPRAPALPSRELGLPWPDLLPVCGPHPLPHVHAPSTGCSPCLHPVFLTLSRAQVMSWAREEGASLSHAGQRGPAFPQHPQEGPKNSYQGMREGVEPCGGRAERDPGSGVRRQLRTFYVLLQRTLGGGLMHPGTGHRATPGVSPWQALPAPSA